jgi:hypothetical protein
MAGYLGSEAAFVSVAIADITGDLTVGVDATVNGNLNAASATVSGNLTATSGILLGSSTDVLDDYEEGTWTPFVVGEVTTSNGTYTKVGSLVTAYFYITLPNIGFSTDPALIDGLPFTANNTSAAQSGKSAGFLSFNSDGKAASLLFETGGSRVGFKNDPNGTAQDRGTVAGNTYYGTLIYNTDS